MIPVRSNIYADFLVRIKIFISWLTLNCQSKNRNITIKFPLLREKAAKIQHYEKSFGISILNYLSFACELF